MSIEQHHEKLIINDEAYISGSLAIKVDGIGELVFFDDFELHKQSNTFRHDDVDDCLVTLSVLTTHDIKIDSVVTPNNANYQIYQNTLKFNLYF